MQSFNSSRNFSPVRDFNATDFGIGERKPLVTSQSVVKKSDMSTIALDAARRIREIQRAKDEALEAVSENEISREIQSIKRELEMTRTHTLMMRLEEAKAKLKTDKPASYTKAIKLVSRYAATEEHRLKFVGEPEELKALAIMAVIQVEAMMDRLPHSYSLGKDHPETPLKDAVVTDHVRRLTDLRRHLDARAQTLDETRNSSLHSMASAHPVLKEIVERCNAGELPEDGTLIIMSSRNHYLAPMGSKSPHFIEVQRLKSGGVGADGAGFNRFAQDLNHISGAIIMRPIYDENGEALQVPSKSQNGKPVFRKQVVDVIGSVPSTIMPGLDFLQILRRFKPAD